MLFNSKMSYGSVAKWLHWIIALLFLGSYGSIKYRHWLTEKETPENWTALQLHLAIGVSIGLFVLLRLIWRTFNTSPDLPPGSFFEHLSAKLVRFLLYFVMIAMPITGYIGTGVATDFFGLFTIPKFEDTLLFSWLVENQLQMNFDTFEKPIDFFHKNIGGEYLVWILIAVHAAAALYHHFMKKNDVLLRMLPGRHR